MPGVLAVVTAADLDLRRPRPGHADAATRSMTAPAAGPRRRALRRRADRRHRHRASRAGARRGRGRVRRLRTRCRPGRPAAVARTTRRSCSTRPAPTSCGRSTTAATPVDFTSLRGRRHTGDGQPAAGAQPHRGPLGRGLVGGRPARPVPELPGRPPRARRHRRGVRPRPERGPRGVPGRRRQLRGQGGRRPPSCSLLGELSRRVDRPVRWFETRTENMVGHGPRSGPAPAGHPGRHARRPHHRLQARGRAGLRRLPVNGRGAAVHDPDDDHAASTRWATSSSRPPAWSPPPRPSSPTAAPADPRRPPPSSGWSTSSPPRSAWTRPRCAASTCCRPDVFPFTTPTGTEYDSGDYARALDLVLGHGRLRRAAGRAGAPAGRRRPEAARHRHGGLRRGHRRRRRVRRGAAAARRHRAGQDRLEPLRPGPPHGVGHVGQRPARASPWTASRSSTATPT